MVFFCEMVILVVFNSFNVVKNLKKPDLVARQKPPFYTTSEEALAQVLSSTIKTSVVEM